jgi:eukaryotic translation initiation factor 2C
MIQNFQAAVFWALQQWCEINHRWPENILYYRDGVSESQYEELQRDEVSLIQAAWDDLAEVATNEPASNLKLTTVIATKRHSTRFFPTRRENAMQNNENCKPGTLVDSVVTNPYFSDFFLQSHNAIKGTARPCHYFVLNNGMGISMTALEDLVSLTQLYCKSCS